MKRKHIIFILLFILAVLFRIQFQYPFHPDHYTWGQYTNLMIKEGYAPWILSPMSLFGYYPLSIPSGFEFFYSTLSLITGLSLKTLFFYGSIFAGLFGGLTLYILMRRWTDFSTSVLTSFVLISMAFFSKVTSNTASNRIFNIVFYPLFIYLLFDIYEKWKTKRTSRIVAAVVELILMALIHRLSQLSVIFIVSFLGALLLHNWDNIVHFLWNNRLIEHRKKVYEHSILHILVDAVAASLFFFGFKIVRSKLLYLIFLALVLVVYTLIVFRKKKHKYLYLADLGVFALMVIAIKLLDLYVRGRFLVHLQKLLEIKVSLYGMYVIFSSMVVIVLLSIVFHKFFGRLFERLHNKSEKIVHRIIYLARFDSKKLIDILLTIGVIAFFSYAFLAGGLLHMDTTYYENSFLFHGGGKLVVLANFLLNLNNNLTILIWFSIIGIWFLLKSQKTIYHYFFIIVTMIFSQFMFDWEYIRLYMNPIYAIWIGLGLSFAMRFVLSIRRRPLRALALTLFLILIVGHFALSNIFMHRDQLFDKLGIEKARVRIPEEQYIASGDYLSHFDKDDTITFSNGNVRYQRTAYYSGLLTAVDAQGFFTQQNYEVKKMSSKEILDRLLSGKKVQQIYSLHDWILGKNYYHGRHARYYTLTSYLDRTSLLIQQIYHIRYIMDSKLFEKKNKLFKSIKPVKNKIYSSDDLDIYDLSKGIE